MEEKIIEAKFTKNKITFVLLIISYALLIIGLITAISEFTTGETYEYFGYGHGLWVPNNLHYDSFFSFLIAAFVFETAMFSAISIYLGILMIIATFIVSFGMNRCALTVTNKRVTGKASFGMQVDLPLNQISAISLGGSNSICVATSSGKIAFWCLENRTEVYNALSDLLSNLQSNQVNSIPANAATNSNADELGKYKDLLDKGIITQEEFDAKKKQLLGL